MMTSVKILQYFQMECNSARKIIEGVLREYSVLWQHKYQSPMTLLKALCTLAGYPLNVEVLDFSLSSLTVNPALGAYTRRLWLPQRSIQSIRLDFFLQRPINKKSYNIHVYEYSFTLNNHDILQIRGIHLHWVIKMGCMFDALFTNIS